MAQSPGALWSVADRSDPVLLDKLRTPIGTSSLDAVLDLNDLEPEQKTDVRETMRREGFFQFGGGAEAEITMYEEGAWRELIATIEENHLGAR